MNDKHWDGKYFFEKNVESPHEAGVLMLSIEKAIKYLNWKPKWDFAKSIEVTINWYKDVYEENKSAIECSLNNLNEYINAA